MSKQRLHVDFEFDFEVLGIVSSLKDYKLAWQINNLLGVELIKEKDVIIQFTDYELFISNYRYATDASELKLLRNRSYELSGDDNLLMIPELPRIDYFLTFSQSGDEMSEADVTEKIRKVQGVEFVYKLDIETLKSKENFIF